MSLSPGLCAQIACVLEVSAPKAGNVHRERDFADTTYLDFLLSAAAIAPALELAGARGVGETVLDAIERTPSTLDAHRLIHWAGIEGVQTAVVSALFTAYFVESRDIGNREVLGDIADACGLDASLILRLLASEADRREIVEMDATARGMGVTSVPTFVVAGQHAVPGAQPAELWSRVIAELKDGGARAALA